MNKGITDKRNTAITFCPTGRVSYRHCTTDWFVVLVLVRQDVSKGACQGAFLLTYNFTWGAMVAAYPVPSSPTWMALNISGNILVVPGTSNPRYLL